MNISLFIICFVVGDVSAASRVSRKKQSNATSSESASAGEPIDSNKNDKFAIQTNFDSTGSTSSNNSKNVGYTSDGGLVKAVLAHTCALSNRMSWSSSGV